MGVVQRTGAGSNPRISHVVSKLDRDHRTATTDNRTLGLTPGGTISHSNLSLGPLHCTVGTLILCNLSYFYVKTRLILLTMAVDQYLAC